jgi:hypothetical protein
MVTSLRQKAVVGAAGVAVLAGAGGAYAATRGSSAPPTPAKVVAARNAFLDDAAKRLHVTRAQLEAALKGAAADRVDAAVAAGRLTKKQGDAIKQRIQQGAGLLGAPGLGLHRPGGRGFGFGFGFGFRLGFGPGKSLDAAATYLGLTKPQLRQQLRSGKSLAAIAKSRGKSVTGLESAIRTAVADRFEQAVKNGRLTDAQRKAFLSAFDKALPDLVNRPLPAGPRFRQLHP